MIKRIAPITIQQQLYEEISKDINSGKYKPGDKIPTEYELSNYYNVSRVTVRAAIQQLVNENKLIKKIGKGTFVKHHVHIETIVKSGSFTENCRQRGAKPSTKIVECKLSVGSDDIVNILSTKNKNIIQITRIRYVDDVPCIVEVDYFPDKYDFLLTYSKNDESLIDFFTKKAKITPTIFVDQFSIEYANKEYAKYLNCQIRTPLLQVCQTVKEKNGKVVYYNKQYILTSKYTYVKQ